LLIKCRQRHVFFPLRCNFGASSLDHRLRM
jgi:hypothetical protein